MQWPVYNMDTADNKKWGETYFNCPYAYEIGVLITCILSTAHNFLRAVYKYNMHVGLVCVSLTCASVGRDLCVCLPDWQHAIRVQYGHSTVQTFQHPVSPGRISVPILAL